MIYYDIHKEKIDEFDKIKNELLKDVFLINTWYSNEENDVGYTIRNNNKDYYFTFSTFDEKLQKNKRFATLSVFLEREKNFKDLGYPSKSCLVFLYVLNFDVENIDGGKLLYLKEKLDFIDERMFLKYGKFLPIMNPPYLIKYSEENTIKEIPDEVLDELDYISLGYFATYDKKLVK